MSDKIESTMKDIGNLNLGRIVLPHDVLTLILESNNYWELILIPQ